MDVDGARDALVLYGREGCHLCDDAQAILAALLERRARSGLPAPVVRIIDIDGDMAAHDAFHATIPVIAWGDQRLELAVSAGAIGRFLAEALDAPAAGNRTAEGGGGRR